MHIYMASFAVGIIVMYFTLSNRWVHKYSVVTMLYHQEFRFLRSCSYRVQISC